MELGINNGFRRSTKIRLFFCVTLFKVHLSIAQTFLTIGGGYSLPWAVQDAPDGNIEVFDDGTRMIDVYKYSLGQGKNYALSAAHRISKSLDVGCSVVYVDGRETTRTVAGTNFKVNSKTEGSMLWITPTVKINLLNKGSLSPFIRFGIGIGVLGKIWVENEDITSFGNLSVTQRRLSNGLAYGVHSGIGLAYTFKKDKRWGMFIEMSSINASYGPKRGEVVARIKDNIDVFSTLSTSQKITIYKNSYIRNDNAPSDPDKPGFTTRRFYQFSSIGLNLGVSYKL
jgi:hypothetical protein